MSQEILASAIVPPDLAVVTGGRRRANNRALHAAAGFLGSALVLLIGVFGYRQWLQRQVEAPEDTKGPAASANVPLPPVKSDVPQAPDAQPGDAAPPEPPQAPPPAASASAGATVASAAQAPAPTPAVTTAAPTKSTAAPTVKKPTTGPVKKQTPAPAVKTVCTGVGVFERCKKVAVNGQ